MSIRLNGWQRLWVLVSGIYLILVIFFAAISLPKPESIPHSQTIYNQLAPGLRDKIIDGKTSYEIATDFVPVEPARPIRKIETDSILMLNGHTVIFYSEVTKDEKEAIEKQYRVIIEKLTTKKQLKHIGIAFILWIVPLIALYLLGLSIGWVYRGFKSQKM